MPDWVTHIVLGLIAAEFLHIPKKSVVLAGALLPDLLPKLVLLRLFIPLPELNYGFLQAFHTPIVFFLFSILVAPLFQYDHNKIIGWLTLGGMTHFLADVLLRHFHAGVCLLYPFSNDYYTLNLVWPEQSYLILIPAVILYIGIWWHTQWRSKN